MQRTLRDRNHARVIEPHRAIKVRRIRTRRRQRPRIYEPLIQPTTKTNNTNIDQRPRAAISDLTRLTQGYLPRHPQILVVGQPGDADRVRRHDKRRGRVDIVDAGRVIGIRNAVCHRRRVLPVGRILPSTISPDPVDRARSERQHCRRDDQQRREHQCGAECAGEPLPVVTSRSALCERRPDHSVPSELRH